MAQILKLRFLCRLIKRRNVCERGNKEEDGTQEMERESFLVSAQLDVDGDKGDVKKETQKVYDV